MVTKPPEWKQAAGRCGYNVPGPVWGTYYKGTALFAWQHGPQWWNGVICGHGSTGGETRELAQARAECWIEGASKRDADRRVTRKQFEALMESKE